MGRRQICSECEEDWEECTCEICPDCDEHFDDCECDPEPGFSEEEQKLLDRWNAAVEAIELLPSYPDSPTRRPARDLVWQWIGLRYANYDPLDEDDWEDTHFHMERSVDQLERWANGSDPLPERHPSADLGPLFKYFQEPTNGS